MIDGVVGSILILVCLWIAFEVMLKIEASIRATSMMSLLSELWVLLARFRLAMETDRQTTLPGLMGEGAIFQLLTAVPWK